MHQSMVPVSYFHPDPDSSWNTWMLIIIGSGCKSVADNVYVHKILLNFRGSSYGTSVKVEYVIESGLNKLYCLLRANKIVQTTCTDWRSSLCQMLVYLEIEIARHATVIYEKVWWNQDRNGSFYEKNIRKLEVHSKASNGIKLKLKSEISKMHCRLLRRPWPCWWSGCLTKRRCVLFTQIQTESAKCILKKESKHQTAGESKSIRFWKW